MLERSLATLFQPGMTTGEALGATIRWDLFRKAMLGYIERWDAIRSPIAAFPAVPHGAGFDADKLPGFSYCVTYNLTGWPNVAVRAGTSPEGLPIGVPGGSAALARGRGAWAGASDRGRAGRLAAPGDLVSVSRGARRDTRSRWSPDRSSRGYPRLSKTARFWLLS